MNEGNQQMIFGWRAGPIRMFSGRSSTPACSVKSPVAADPLQGRPAGSSCSWTGLAGVGPRQAPRDLQGPPGYRLQERAGGAALGAHRLRDAQANIKGLSMDPHGYVNLYDAWIAKS